MIDPQAHLHLVTALACEAKPLSAALQLKKSPKPHPFAYYQHHNIHLIVSGVGANASAAATAYLHAITEQPKYAVYINIGIAGSASDPIGSVHSIDKITDQSTGKKFYPFLHPKITSQLSHCHTHPIPQTQYPENGLVDMEAAGFFTTARRCVAQELVQVIKIISDNTTHSTANISVHSVSSLISTAMPELTQLLTIFAQFSIQESTAQPITVSLAPFLTRWHFSAYQQNQLTTLLRRYAIHQPGSDPVKRFADARSSSEVLNKLTLSMSS